MNDVGKPCAGELHARFEVAGTGNGAVATAPVPDPTQSLFLNPNGQVSAVNCLGLGLPDVPAPPQVASSCVPGEAGKVAPHFAWLGQVEGTLSEPLVMDGAGGP